MEYILALVDFILHIDKHLHEIISNYGTWTYTLLFLIVFAETGLVVTPFLPGDSLLFAAGAFAARGALDVWTVYFSLIVAAILGDTVNYSIGRYLAPRMEKGIPFIKQKHLDKTHAFYEKHGGKTIVIARFMPIVRTFAPFVAGVGAMDYRKFVAYNISGAFLWVTIFVWGGYFFGNLPAVEENFTLVILAIIFLSVLPPVIEYLRHRRADRA